MALRFLDVLLIHKFGMILGIRLTFSIRFYSRLSASQCLEHQWLTGSYLDTLKQLETTWMRKYLAKRRWQRWFNAVRAMNRIKHLGQVGLFGAKASNLRKKGAGRQPLSNTFARRKTGAKMMLFNFFTSLAVSRLF